MSNDHPLRLYSSAQVRELDLRAIRELGLSDYALMQRAARSCFCVLQRRWPDAHHVAVICGPGNNGGDGYELARIAHDAGMRVSLARTGPEPARGAAHQALKAWKACGGETSKFDQGFADTALAQAQVICDAIFGIGIARRVEGIAAEAIHAINAQRDRCGVLAVDIPSGLDADSGAVRGVSVIAHDTVSFIGRKRGLYLGAGPDHCGRRHFDDLGTGQVDRPADGIRLLHADDLKRRLPRRSAGAHKGRHGHVLIVGGDHGMAGAALLAARGALRSGAGLVSVATRPEHAVALVGSQAEVMAQGVDDDDGLKPLLNKASVIVAGPGLGQGDWSRKMLGTCLLSDKPLILDADALNLVAEDQEFTRTAPTVLTPHPGEAARLLDRSTADVQVDRVGTAEALRDQYSAVAVLKGAGSLIAGREVSLCADGNPGMGVGGMGDVLTGVIAALMGQGLDAEDAAALGVLSHAIAGDIAAADCPRGLLPSDLINALRRVLNPI